MAIEGMFYDCRRAEYEEERRRFVLRAFVGGELLEDAVAALRRVLWVGFIPYIPIT